MITRDDVIDEWVYCNYDSDNESSITTRDHLPEELIQDIVYYANRFLENPKNLDQTELDNFSKLSDQRKKEVSIYKAFEECISAYIHDLGLILDSAYDNMSIILKGRECECK